MKDPKVPALPHCPAELPAELRAQAAQLAFTWASHPLRPRPPAAILDRWDVLLDEWVATTDLPLYIRKTSEDRGSRLLHPSGRALVPVDNSTAQWAFALACGGVCPTLDELRHLMSTDQVPVAMILKKSEAAIATYKRILSGSASPNAAGWKLGHIDKIGLAARGAITAFGIEQLERHFRLFLAPRNMFAVPTVWGGLAEIPEMIAAIRQADHARAAV